MASLSAATLDNRRAWWSVGPWRGRLAIAGSMAPAAIALAVILIWAAHDGGYDADTWYWGALVLLAALSALIASGRSRVAALPRACKLALICLGLYVAWSYASIAWAAYPGDALQGSNRALLYLLLAVVFALTPWTVRRATAALTAFAGGIGAIGVVLLERMASGGAGPMFSEGRLVSPAGYFNATAALFTIGALVAIALSARRELPLLARGALIGLASGELELAVLGQSRGWLFTLPLVLLLAAALVRDRLRTLVAAIAPIVATIAALPSLLAVYHATLGAHPPPAALTAVARHAGVVGLLTCLGALAVGALLAAADKRLRAPTPSRAWRRGLGVIAAGAVVAAAGAGVSAATHGDPLGFLDRQWQGFTHPGVVYSSAGSHFGAVGTGRYDAWRVALDAFLAHPIGGLGQDNFADYYIRRRHTAEELQWTHSLEMRLLAHTGLVGTLLFVLFLGGALLAALRTRGREAAEVSAVAGVALLPLVVWLVHGSIDWFWEIPALTGPALGFLIIAGALGPAPADQRGARAVVGRKASRVLLAAAGSLALIAAVGVLGFPYLSVREASTANDIRGADARVALQDLRTAARLDPLSAEPDRIGGTIALQIGDYPAAQRLFDQAIAREPGGWYGWLGAGLAASALGERSRAYHDFTAARAINSQQPAIAQALERVYGKRPLAPSEGLRLLVLRN